MKTGYIVGGAVAALVLVIGIGMVGASRATPPLAGVPAQPTPSIATTIPYSPRATPEPVSAPSGPVAYGEGTLLVGTDIPAGTYRSPGAAKRTMSYCSWKTLDGAATNSDVIDYGSATLNDPIVVEIGDGVKAFHSSGCEPWTKVG